MYAVAFRQMFGRDVSAYPDVTHFPPRYVAQSVWPGDQKAVGGQVRNGKVTGGRAIAPPINGPGGVSAKWLATGFPIVPEKLKPGVLWAWNRLTNTDPAKVGKEGGLDESLLFGRAVGGENFEVSGSSYVFLNYPLDLQPKHPSECFENTWEANTKGLHIFRNGWQGTDDIVLQTHLKTQINKGHNQPNAGTFNLQGLGKEWACCFDGRDGPRWDHSVVMLPEDDERVNVHEIGNRTYYRAEKDGSGVLSVNLDFLYSGGKTYKRDEQVRRMSLCDQNGLPIPENLAPDGIKGMRGFGVDYSGKSGAPMLLVLVDQIIGGGERWWLWNAPSAAVAGLRFDRNTFTLTQDDANLKATFVCPTEVRFAQPGKETYKQTTKITIEVGGRKKPSTKTEVKPIGAIVAKGAGHFFVVVTLQRGPAPEVRVEGQGLDAKVTVGKQKVRFDGQKVIFGE
jgi:hypothetical protein